MCVGYSYSLAACFMHISYALSVRNYIANSDWDWDWDCRVFCSVAFGIVVAQRRRLSSHWLALCLSVPGRSRSSGAGQGRPTDLQHTSSINKSTRNWANGYFGTNTILLIKFANTHTLPTRYLEEQHKQSKAKSSWTNSIGRQTMKRTWQQEQHQKQQQVVDTFCLGCCCSSFWQLLQQTWPTFAYKCVSMFCWQLLVGHTHTRTRTCTHLHLHWARDETHTHLHWVSRFEAFALADSPKLLPATFTELCLKKKTTKNQHAV